MALHLDDTKPLAAVTAAVHTPSVNQVQNPQVKATRPVCSWDISTSQRSLNSSNS